MPVSALCLGFCLAIAEVAWQQTQSDSFAKPSCSLPHSGKRSLRCTSGPCVDGASGKTLLSCDQVGIYTLHGPVINVGYGRPDVNKADVFAGVGSNTNAARDYPADQLIAEWGAGPQCRSSYQHISGNACCSEITGQRMPRWGCAEHAIHMDVAIHLEALVSMPPCTDTVRGPRMQRATGSRRTTWPS